MNQAPERVLKIFCAGGHAMGAFVYLCRCIPRPRDTDLFFNLRPFPEAAQSMGFLNWLKSLFTDTQAYPHEYVPSDHLLGAGCSGFEPGKLRLKEEGEVRGRNNLPATNQSGLDNVEARIVNTIQSEVAIAQERFARHMRAYGERQSTLKIH